MAARDIIEEMRQARVGREKSDANREGFFELHQAQKVRFHTGEDRLDNFESGPGINLDSISRLRVYVALDDPNLGVFINNAQSKAKTAYLSGTRNWHHHYTIDIADVDITMRGRAVHIRITPADAFKFEFASSGKPLTTVFEPTFGTDLYKLVIVGTDVRIDKSVMHTSSSILQGRRDTFGQNLSQIKRASQVQLVSEPVMYTNAKMKLGRIRATDTLFQSYAPYMPWTGATLRDTDAPFATFGQSTACGPGSMFASRDRGFDIPWGDNEKTSDTRYAYMGGAADWPRASGKQLVKSKEFGEREFAIYVDAFGQFMIFPTAAIGPIGGTPPTGNPYAQNVQDVYVKRITPTLPTWCWKPAQKAMDYWSTNPDVFELCVDQPEFDWKFHPEGTHCACIVIEREEYKFDTTFWATDSNPDCPMNSTKFDDWKSWMGSNSNYVQAFSPSTYNNARYFIAPGIIELDIDIKITGPDLNQFDATIRVHELMQPSICPPDNSPWPMFVDYVWYTTPKRTNTNQIVKAGTLVALTMELWIHPQGTLGEETDRQTIWSVRNVRNNAEVFSAVGGPLLGLDLRTLSMVLRLDGYNTIQRQCGDGTILNFPVHHFGAWIIHSGVGKEVLYPQNIPAGMKLIIDSYAKLNGREFLATRMASTGPPWTLLPVTTPYDGWSNTDFADLRNWWAYQDWLSADKFFALVDADIGFYGDHVKYKTSGTPPAYPATGDVTQTWLNAVGGDWFNLNFCDYPRWGWNAYCALVPGDVALNIQSTFFAHPNGSYGFWSNDWLYDQNGLPGDYVIAQGAGGQAGVSQGSGADYTHNTLAVYDPLLVEHVVFDRVHFEIRSTNRKATTHNTTFLKLYNDAVAKGLRDRTLEDGIIPLATSDLCAELFTKEIGDDAGNEYLFLDLKMTWSGRDWWYRESAYFQGYATGTQYPPIVGTAANFNNINVCCYWRTANFAGSHISYSPGSTSNAPAVNWHMRFADPIIIMEK